MRQSDDLAPVVAAVFPALRAFAPELDCCVISAIDEDRGLVRA